MVRLNQPVLLDVGAGAKSRCPIAIHAEDTETVRISSLLHCAVKATCMSFGQFVPVLSAVPIDMIQRQESQPVLPTTGTCSTVMLQYFRLQSLVAQFGALQASLPISEPILCRGSLVGRRISYNLGTIPYSRLTITEIPTSSDGGAGSTARFSWNKRTGSAVPARAPFQALPVQGHSTRHRF